MWSPTEDSMDFCPEEATLAPPRTPFPHGCGRLAVRFATTSDGSENIQLAPPVPAKICQGHHQDIVGPEISMEMPVPHVWQGSSFEQPVDQGDGRCNNDCVGPRTTTSSFEQPVEQGSVGRDGRCNNDCVGPCTTTPPWQGIAHEMPADDTAFGPQLMQMQRQLAYMIQEQDKMQAVVGKVCVGMDALLAQQLAGVQSDPPSNTARGRISGRKRGNSGHSLQRSCTVLPRQKQFMKEISDIREGHPNLTVVDAPAKAGGHRDGGRLFGSERSSASADDEDAITERGPPSRNHFADKRATENDDMCMLRELFLAAEAADEEAETSYRRLNYLEYCLSVWRTMDRQAAEVMLESAVGVVIGLNALCIGLSMDSSEEDKFVWILIDACFSFVFLVELSAKVWMNGFWFHFCGPRRCWRMFDFSLIVMDLIQFLLATVLHDASQGVEGAPSASLFRTVRLGKLARMLRLLKSSVFNDLLAMLQGLLGALATLGWAMVLFIAVVYFVALLFREFFGKEDVPNVSESFSSVPRAMFTTFRCSFGDCSAPSGVPIFVHVANEYGPLSCLTYCLFVFVITIGLFNVISAIFVETTLAAAAALQVQKKKNRLRDYTLWCTNVAKLVKRLMVVSNLKDDATYDPGVKLTEALDDVYQLEVPCEDIDLLVQDPEAICALTALDIVPEDRDYLSDILDPDSGGTINVIELVEGLRRLRGDPRRSDIVTINLMIRSVQKDVTDMFEVLDKIFASLRGRRSP